MKGLAPILILALWLSPSQALPDLLAPFRNMFGMSKQSNSQASSGSNVKQLTASKDPSASHVHRQFGGGGGPPGGPHGGPHGGPEDSDPFHSNFGFGSPPHDDDHHSPPHHHGGPGGPGGPGPGPNHFAPGGRGPSSRPSNKPHSASPTSKGGARQVRQQPLGYYGQGHGSGNGSPRPSHSSGQSHPLSHRPSQSLGGRPGGGPGGFHGGPPHETQDDHSEGPDSFQGGPPQFNPRGPPSHHSQSQSPSFQNGPSFHSSSPKYNQGGGGGAGGPPQFSNGGGEPGPYPDGPPAGTQFATDDSPSDGPGFSGFGAFPQNSPENDEDGPPPPGAGGPRRPPQGGRGGPGGFRGGPGGASPFRASRPGPDYEASSSPPRYPGGGPGPGPSSAPPAFFGGPSNYPEQYEGGNRDTRQQPEIITADDVNRYPPQIDDEEQGPQGGGFGGPPQGFGGPSHSSSAPPSFFPSSGSFSQEDGQGGPPQYHHGSGPGPRYPSGSGNSYAFSRPVSARYQASAESIHYGKPMMMSASGVQETRVKPNGHIQKKRSPRPPRNQEGIKQLNSPKDPNYRGGMSFGGSSLNPISAPYEPDTAATGHGGHGIEGLSSNGDRILYHVAGHQGPYSYRFGYDTGKGYNRLFRFEEKDGKGYVKGKYGFYDKHGKLNVINYEAHPKHGYHAERGHSHGYY